MSYGLSKDFERTSVLLAARSKNFWLRIGSRLDPEEVIDPANKLLLRLCRAVAADHGWPDEELIIQRASNMLSEGSMTESDLGMVADLLGERPDADPEKVVQELIAPVRAVLSSQLSRAVIDRYKNGGVFGTKLLEDMDACDRLGSPVAEVEIASSEFGEDTETTVLEAPTGRKILTGIYEVDSLFKGGWPLGTLLTLLMDSKVGKCHRFDTPILMYDGTIKPVQAIVPGDQLMGPSSDPRTVLRTGTGFGEMYDIRPSKGASWAVNVDHVLTLANIGSPNHGARQEREWVDVSVREWLSWPRTKKAHYRLIRSPAVEFPPGPELPVDPYLLGVVLGDGSTRSGSVLVTTADPEIREELESQAAKLGLRLVMAADAGAAQTWRFSSVKGGKNHLVTAMRTLGIYGHRSENKQIPQAYRVSDLGSRLQILAGLLDTDGHLSKTHGVHFDYITKSEQLAQDVVFIARSCGLYAESRPCRKGCQTGAIGTYYRVTITGETWKIPTRLPRKRAVKASRGQWASMRPKFSVIPSGSEETYYGFTLDGDGRYLLGDFTVTHNSMTSCYLTACAILQGENAGYLSLELPKSEIHKRVLAAVVGTAITDLEDPRILGEALRYWKELKRTGRIGRLFIEKLEAGTVDTNGMAAWFRHQEKVHDARIRYRVVDYGDLITSPRKADADDGYNRGKTVWQALANMAQDPEAPNWVLSPTQSKRPDFKLGQPIPVLTRKDLSDSVHKVRITDFLISGTPQPDIRASAGFQWYIDADRFLGKTGELVGPVPHFMAMGRMADMSHITNKEPK